MRLAPRRGCNAWVAGALWFALTGVAPTSAAPTPAELIEAVEAADGSIERLRVEWTSTTVYDPVYATDFAWCWCARRTERGWCRPAAGLRGPSRYSVSADGDRWREVRGEAPMAYIECFDGVEYWSVSPAARPAARPWVERTLEERNTRYGVLSSLLLNHPANPWAGALRECASSIADSTCLGEPAVGVVLTAPDDPTAAMRVWFVPGRGWRAGHVQELMSDTVLVDRHVDEWQQTDGRWLPKRVTSTHYGSPEPTAPVSLWMTARIEVLGASFPAAIPESEFQIDLGSLPETTRVDDLVEDVSYEIGPPNDAARDLVVDAAIARVRNTPAGDEPKVPTDLVGRRSPMPMGLRGPQALALLLRQQGQDVTGNDLVPLPSHGLVGLTQADAARGVATDVLLLNYEELADMDELAVVSLGREHWVLFVGVRAGRAYVIEPPDQIRSMSPEDFRARWTGEALMPRQQP